MKKLLQHGYACIQNQKRHAYPDSPEGTDNQRMRGNPIQKSREHADHPESRKHNAKRRSDGPGKAGSFIAHVGSAVDGDGTGGRLRRYRQIQHLVLRHPQLFLHADIGDHRNHGVTAAKGEQAHFQELKKQLPQLPEMDILAHCDPSSSL